MSLSCLKSQLMIFTHSLVKKYQLGWRICDDGSCKTRTNNSSVFGTRCLVSGCTGHLVEEFTDEQLYTQLVYLERMFDLNDKDDREKKTAYAEYEDDMSALQTYVRRMIQKNARMHIHLGNLFSFS